MKEKVNVRVGDLLQGPDRRTGATKTVLVGDVNVLGGACDDCPDCPWEPGYGREDGPTTVRLNDGWRIVGNVMDHVAIENGVLVGALEQRVLQLETELALERGHE